MSYHQRPHELRLAISSEAEAVLSDFGARPTLKLRCRGDDRSQVGNALIRTRRLIRLNRRTLIRGHGAA
jgi:hypothetical protein